MKRKKTNAEASIETSVSFAFTRGFVAAGLLAACSGPADGRRDASGLKIFRLALQGGTALAAGTYAARAIRRRDVGSAVVGTVAGAAAVLAAEQLLPDPSERNAEESRNGQKET